MINKLMECNRRLDILFGRLRSVADCIVDPVPETERDNFVGSHTLQNALAAAEVIITEVEYQVGRLEEAFPCAKGPMEKTCANS